MKYTMIVGKYINLGTLQELLFNGEKVIISDECIQEVDKGFRFLKDFSSDKIIYGINTGFGPMAQYRIEDKSLTELQYNIIRSHSTGAGKPLPPLYVKAAMIARLFTFLQGKSGIHTELVELLVKFINLDIFPYIPEHGSVGASGDLVQLAHIALTLIGEGEVFYQGQLQPTAQVLEKNHLKPFSIHIREGLSVTNGTSVMTGIGIVNLIYARQLLNWSVCASVMMNEIAASYDDFVSQPLNDAKLHKGQQKIAKAMRSLGRFTINATFGIGGLFDVASNLGMPKPYEDFGLTLVHYGIGKGPYLVLPILGPSSLRDSLGMGVDTLGKGTLYHISDLDKLNHLGVSTLYAINERGNIPFEYYQTGSPFEYEYIRFLYFKYRKLQAELGSEVF